MNSHVIKFVKEELTKIFNVKERAKKISGHLSDKFFKKPKVFNSTIPEICKV